MRPFPFAAIAFFVAGILVGRVQVNPAFHFSCLPPFRMLQFFPRLATFFPVACIRDKKTSTNRNIP